MDIYHAFFDLTDGQSDVAFADDLAAFLNQLATDGKIARWRLMRRKLGLAPRELGEFHLMIETDGLAQLDAAFQQVSSRSGDIEDRHARVNQKIAQISFALYRDFPDPQRRRGGEKF